MTAELLAESEGGAQTKRFVGGTSLIPLRLAETLGERIVLDAPVLTIDHAPDRVTVTWADATDPAAPPASRAVLNGWLEATLRSNARTGLAAPDTFTFGNLAGDTGGAGAPAVDGLDAA